MAANPLLVSNQVLQEIQPVTYPNVERTGTIIYANKYAGIGQVEMPDDWKEALNSDLGCVGNNILVQLQQKVDLVDGGPWYVDSINGVIYIHNKKFYEPPVAEYNYQAENGELLRASFETKYITHARQESMSDDLSGMTKGISQNYSGMTIDDSKKVVQNTQVLENPWTSKDAETVVYDLLHDRTTYEAVEDISETVKALGGGEAFTLEQWSIMNKYYQDKNDRLISTPNTEVIANIQDNTRNSKSYLYTDAVGYFSKRIVSPSDLTIYIRGILYQLSGGDQGYYNEMLREVDEAAAKGAEALDELAKRYKDVKYEYHVWGPTKNIAVWDEVVNDETRPGFGHHHTVGNGWRAHYKPSIGVVTKIVSFPEILHYCTRTNTQLPAVSLNNHWKKSVEKKLIARVLVVGRPNLESSQKIRINNVGKAWSGDWYIKTCVHKLDPSSGYTTEMDLVHSRAEFKPTSYHGDSIPSIEGNSFTTTSDYKPIATKTSTGYSVQLGEGRVIDLNNSEGEFYNAALERGDKVGEKDAEDLLILKKAGVQNAISFSGQVGPISGEQEIVKKLYRRPTNQEYVDYGPGVWNYIQTQRAPEAAPASKGYGGKFDENKLEKHWKYLSSRKETSDYLKKSREEKGSLH